MNRRLKPIFTMAPPEDSGESGDTTQQGGAAAAPAKPADEKPADDGKTFTQADVERIIAGRFQKYADYDDLKNQVAELSPLKEQFDTIARAFGKQDDKPADPAELAKQVSAEQAKAREAAVQLAVYRTAGTAGANPDALLDSASFLRTLAQVDPSDTAAVTAAINAAVEANPRLKVETEAPFPTAGQAGICVTGGGSTPTDPRSADLAQIEADLRATKRP